MTSRLVIDFGVFQQLVTDPAFFAALPPGLEGLSAPAGEAVAVAQAIAQGKPPGECSGCGSVREALQPIMNRYAQALYATREDDPAALDDLHAYIEKRRGVKTDQFSWYYKDERGKVAHLEF